MEIGFSQTGQNVANIASDIANKSRPQDVSAEDSARSSNQTAQQQNVQAERTLADNNADRSSVPAFDVETAVAEISDFLQSTNRQLTFSVDEGTNRSVVEVKDSESGDVIRQIPSEEVLQLSERIKELQTDVGSAVGVLFNNQA